MPTTAADNIYVVTHDLVARDQITKTQLFDIIEALLKPYRYDYVTSTPDVDPLYMLDLNDKVVRRFRYMRERY